MFCGNFTSLAFEDSELCGRCDSQMKYFALCDAGSTSPGLESMRQRGAMCAERKRERERERPGPTVNYSLEAPHTPATARLACLSFLLDLSGPSETALSHCCQSEPCLCVLHSS